MLNDTVEVYMKSEVLIVQLYWRVKGSNIKNSAKRGKELIDLCLGLMNWNLV